MISLIRDRVFRESYFNSATPLILNAYTCSLSRTANPINISRGKEIHPNMPKHPRFQGFNAIERKEDAKI